MARQLRWLAILVEFLAVSIMGVHSMRSTLQTQVALRGRPQLTHVGPSALPIATANPGTLRASDLAAVFDGAGADIVGSQEACIPGEGWVKGPTYNMLHSGQTRKAVTEPSSGYDKAVTVPSSGCDGH